MSKHELHTYDLAGNFLCPDMTLEMPVTTCTTQHSAHDTQFNYDNRRTELSPTYKCILSGHSSVHFKKYIHN